MKREEVRTIPDWAKYHATFFGFRNDEDLGMLAAWADHFAKADYAVADLLEATLSVASAPPKYRADQYQMLQDCVHVLQRQRQSQVPSVDEQGPPCIKCGTAGILTVPHPKTLNGTAPRTGHWYTLAVICDCGRGQALRKKSPMMTLEKYEQDYPHWRGVMDDHEAMETARRKAQAVTRAADTRLGAILVCIGQLPRNED